jgi:hypothetical protein
MHPVSRLAAVGTIGLGLLLSSWSAIAQGGAGSSAQPRRGFMWEARKDAQRVYLVGTIHVGRAEFHSVPPDVLARYGEASAIAVEADISDPVRIAPIVQQIALYAPAEPGLATRLAPALRERVDKVAARYGVGPAQYARMKPWMLANTLIVLEAVRIGLNPAYSKEAFLFGYARSSSKPIVELEGVEQQLRLFDTAPAEVQTAYLEHAVASLEGAASERELKRVVTAWEKGDAAEMERIVASMRAASGAAEKFVAHTIIDARHPALVAAIERLAASGKLHLVAVGSLHYFGPNGLLELLRKRGYTITPLP